MKTSAIDPKKSRRRAQPSRDEAEASPIQQRVSAQILEERRRVMAVLKPVVALMERMLSPNIELVLHDLTTPDASVVAIANGALTGRRVGSPILSGPKDDVAFQEALQMTQEVGAEGHVLVGAYPTSNAAGAALKSATVIYRDATGAPFAALCMNADQSLLKAAREWLSLAIDGPMAVQETPGTVEAAEMDVLIAEIVETAIKATGKTVAHMTKSDKTQAVEQMLRRGLFAVKGGVPRAARALSISRHTIYNYLAQIKARAAGADET